MDYVVEHEVRIGQVPDYASTGQVLLPENPIEDAESTVARRLAFLHLQMNEVLSPSTMEAFTQDVRRMSLQKSRKLIDQRSPLRSDGSRMKCLRAHDERGQLAMHGFALCTAKSGGAGWKTCYYVYTTAVIGSFSTLYDCINDLEKITIMKKYLFFLFIIGAFVSCAQDKERDQSIADSLFVQIANSPEYFQYERALSTIKPFIFTEYRDLNMDSLHQKVVSANLEMDENCYVSDPWRTNRPRAAVFAPELPGRPSYWGIRRKVSRFPHIRKRGFQPGARDVSQQASCL